MFQDDEEMDIDGFNLSEDIKQMDEITSMNYL